MSKSFESTLAQIFQGLPNGDIAAVLQLVGHASEEGVMVDELCARKDKAIEVKRSRDRAFRDAADDMLRAGVDPALVRRVADAAIGLGAATSLLQVLDAQLWHAGGSDWKE